jgi:hypothetical protein
MESPVCVNAIADWLSEALPRSAKHLVHPCCQSFQVKMSLAIFIFAPPRLGTVHVDII